MPVAAPDVFAFASRGGAGAGSLMPGEGIGMGFEGVGAPSGRVAAIVAGGGSHSQRARRRAEQCQVGVSAAGATADMVWAGGGGDALAGLWDVDESGR